MINEPCAVVLRLAPTFFRFGSFETFKERDSRSGMVGPSVGLKEAMMPQMLEFVIRNYYSQIFDSAADQPFTKLQYQLFYEEVVSRTAMMVAQWQCLGYVHGVMNTDNMSILGLTIDYGPFGFMEYFNPRMVSNHSDNEGRYAYENQPAVCKFNLLRLAEALDPLLPVEWSANYANTQFDQIYSEAYLNTMARKLGFITSDQEDRERLEEQVFEVIKSLFKVLEECSTDFTNTFRFLQLISKEVLMTEGDKKVIELLV